MAAVHLVLGFAAHVSMNKSQRLCQKNQISVLDCVRYYFFGKIGIKYKKSICFKGFNGDNVGFYNLISEMKMKK